MITASLSVARRALGDAAALSGAALADIRPSGKWRELSEGRSSSEEDGQSMPGTRILCVKKRKEENHYTKDEVVICYWSRVMTDECVWGGYSTL